MATLEELERLRRKKELLEEIEALEERTYETSKKTLKVKQDTRTEAEKTKTTRQQEFDQELKRSDLEIENLRRQGDMDLLSRDRIQAADTLFQLEEKRKRLSEEALAIADRMTKKKKDGTLVMSEKELKLAEKNLIAQRNMMARTDDLINGMKQKGIVAKELNQIDEEGKKEAEDFMQELAKGSVLFTTANTGTIAGLNNLAKKLKHADDPMGLLTNSFGQFFNVTQFSISTVQKFAESTMDMTRKLDEANASFAAATGLGDKFQGTLLDMRQEGNTAGVTFENAGAALKGLTENMVGFTLMSKSAQVELGKTVAQFERIGIDANTSADLLNTFTLNMGMSEKKAMDMTKQLALMGQSAGISAGKMTKDFEAAFKSLAVYGDKSIEVFQGLASAARAAGVEVATLTSLADKFDTFAGSAETVGKLNALLGSQLSATNMLMMTEDQRIETLVQQVQVGGTAFKDMDRFQQKAIASAAGISDMNEAQRIFGMNMKDYKKYRKDMERQEAVQEKFNKAVEATIPLQEKLKIFMAEFTIAVMPLLEIFEGLIDALIYVMKEMGPVGKTMLLVVAATVMMGTAIFAGIQVFRSMQRQMILNAATLKGMTAEEYVNSMAKNQNTKATIFQRINEKAKMLVQKVSSMFTAKDSVQQKLNTEMKEENNKETEKQIKKQKKSTKGAKKAVPIMLALGAAIMMIGAGAYMAATGMANLVASFRGLSTGEIIAATVALIAFGVGVGLLVSALIGMVAGPQAVLTAGAVGVLLSIGGAVALVGAGVYMAATGMSNLVSSFADLASLGADVILPLTAFVGSLALLMIAGPAGLSAAVGVMATMAALAAGLYAVSIVMDDEGLQNGLENLALVTTGTSARSMTEAATGMAADLKTTVNAAMAQKIELVIKIKDGGLKEMVESVVVSDLKSPAGGPIAKAVASIV